MIGGGEHLYEKYACSDLLEGLDSVTTDTGSDKWTELSSEATGSGDNEKLEKVVADLVHDALYVPIGITSDKKPTTRVIWHYDTYNKSKTVHYFHLIVGSISEHVELNIKSKSQVDRDSLALQESR